MTPQENPTKSCPKCGEQIFSSATKCKHCGGDLRSWPARHKIATTLLILFVGMPLFVGVVSEIISANMADNQAKVAAAQSIVFDVPALMEKNIDQIREIVGKPTDAAIEPTKLQLDVKGADAEWDNTFEKDGFTCFVTYNVRTRKVVDFFIVDPGDQNKPRIMAAGNLKPNDPAYTLKFVEMRKDPSKYTGVMITPKVK